MKKQIYIDKFLENFKDETHILEYYDTLECTWKQITLTSDAQYNELMRAYSWGELLGVANLAEWKQ